MTCALALCLLALGACSSKPPRTVVVTETVEVPVITVQAVDPALTAPVALPTIPSAGSCADLAELTRQALAAGLQCNTQLDGIRNAQPEDVDRQ